MVVRITNYRDRPGPSGKLFHNSTILEITGYRIKYSTVLWLLELQIRRGRKIQTQSNFQTTNLVYCQYKNPIIHIFCTSGWLAIPVNPNKWSYTVFHLTNNIWWRVKSGSAPLRSFPHRHGILFSLCPQFLSFVIGFVHVTWEVDQEHPLWNKIMFLCHLAAINWSNFSVCDKNWVWRLLNVAEVTLWVSLHRTDWNDMFYGKQKFVTVITIVCN
jgi:hypothetical protein